MSAVIRIGDLSAGHCFPPFPLLQGSSNVFINGLAVGRITDPYPTHTCPPASHNAVQSSGSSSVFINGLAVGRIGDSISCGDICANGSPNVFAGG